MVNSKKIAEKDESLSIESKPIVNNKFFENIMQKAINQKEIEHEVKANEPSDEDDDYLNAILMKEGLARNPEKLKKKEDELSYSDSTSNPAPRVLKQSNKPNLSKKNIQKVFSFIDLNC